jgi:hypothetical protein
MSPAGRHEKVVEKSRALAAVAPLKITVFVF